MIYTSYYGNLKKIRATVGLHTVAISQGVPRWYGKGERMEKRLAPSRAMLKGTGEEYDIAYAALLAALDPRMLYEAIGDGGVMLCWEKPGDKCHRRWVAEWFEGSLGVVVPEFGIERSLTKSYAEMPRKPKPPGGAPEILLF